MKWIKKNLVNLILIGIFLTGVCLLLYPTVSDYWNSFHQSRAIAAYAETVANMDEEDYTAILSAAQAYNEKLAEKGTNWVLSDEELEEYNSVLDVGGTGIMGYIEIEKINCSLPIYHGTDDAVLQIAIGHIPGSSLPIGGKSTHCVLSGHRGLPSARLFTDLDQMEIGDTFVIRTLDEVLTYEVDNIVIVLPDEVSSLGIEEGKDLCTLVTCTPYGVNTHRLLVTGHRVENASTALNIRVTADADQIDTKLVASAVAIPILLFLIILVLVNSHKNHQEYLRRAARMKGSIPEEEVSRKSEPKKRKEQRGRKAKNMASKEASAEDVPPEAVPENLSAENTSPKKTPEEDVLQEAVSEAVTAEGGSEDVSEENIDS